MRYDLSQNLNPQLLCNKLCSKYKEQVTELGWALLCCGLAFALSLTPFSILCDYMYSYGWTRIWLIVSLET